MKCKQLLNQCDLMDKDIGETVEDLIRARGKLNDARESYNRAEECISKLEMKLHSLSSKVEASQRRYERVFNKRIKELEEENYILRKTLYKANIFLANRGAGAETTEDETEDASVTRAKSIARTVSIIDTYVLLIYGHNESFRRISYASIFPLYEKLLDRNYEKYLIRKIPDQFDKYVENGRTYVKSLISSVPTKLTKSHVWKENIPKTDNWWKNSGLLALYGRENCPPLDDDPWSLEDITVWFEYSRERSNISAAVYDVKNYCDQYYEEIKDEAGITDALGRLMSPMGLG